MTPPVLNIKWRCLVAALVIAIALVGALSYKSRPASRFTPIWSPKWMGSHWPRKPLPSPLYCLYVRH
ncbi:MAG: hypothetical protein M0Z85_04465 [Gammaproteobacteria bacterium]|nr:hypothetical protein [Gammaproteobacteria bacterium]